MCLQFCTNLWGCVTCFQSGCCVCSHPTKKNSASRIQSVVWSCSSEVKRIFCVGLWQWMKHGSTTTLLKKKIVRCVDISWWKPPKATKNSTVGCQGYGIRILKRAWYFVYHSGSTPIGVWLVPQCVLRFVHIVDAHTFWRHQRVVTNCCMRNLNAETWINETATVGSNALMTSERTCIEDMYES